MRPAIKDEFEHLPISRQRKYQLRKQRDSRCTECGAPLVAGSRCLEHLVKARERQRRKFGTRRRYKGTLSYRLEETAKSAPVKPSSDKPSPRAKPRPASKRNTTRRGK